MRTLNFILLSLTFFWLAGCASVSQQTPAPQTPPMSWDNRVGVLSNIQNWDLDALIAIRNDSNHDSGSANLKWQQSKNDYSLLFFGPLGSNSVKLTGRPGSVLLETAEGKKINAKTPETLLAQQTGWHVPVSSLFYWIRGLPVPNEPAQKILDNENHLVQLAQQGWVIQYLRYTSVNQIDVPSKIFLNNAQMNVKIIINEWKI